ncbi:MAG: 30S ribosomal protein S4 [Methanomassiliicoccales archaeon]|nr:30S ribosomal protein S4 [Methanomassiliicoccales archaeon]
MGDPKFSRRSYDTPSHPWQGERIKAEVVLVNQYGLKNKTEVWKAQSVLRNFRKQSRELQARLRSGDAQAKIEADALLNKCSKIGVLPVEGATLNDILTLSEENILSRRLQTLVFEKGMASTVGQARQMIVHGHIFMNGHRVTIPGYIVTRYEESSIMYDPASPFNDEMHPMRISAEQAAANAELKASKEAEEAAKKAAEAQPTMQLTRKVTTDDSKMGYR